MASQESKSKMYAEAYMENKADSDVIKMTDSDLSMFKLYAMWIVKWQKYSRLEKNSFLLLYIQMEILPMPNTIYN